MGISLSKRAFFLSCPRAFIFFVVVNPFLPFLSHHITRSLLSPLFSAPLLSPFISLFAPSPLFHSMFPFSLSQHSLLSILSSLCFETGFHNGS